MWYIKEDFEPIDGALAITSLFYRPWIAMLALGGLGHRLHQPRLFFDYWTVFLAVVIVRMAVSNVGVKKYKAAQSRRELK